MTGGIDSGRNRGGTLVEVVVALAIVSIVGVVAVGAAAAEARFVRQAGNALRAAALTEEALARLGTMSPEQVEELASSPDLKRRFGPSMPDWQWSVSLVPAGVSAAPDLYDVTVRVHGPLDSHETRTRLYLRSRLR